MCTLDGVCRTCRGALSYWDGRQRISCWRCTGTRVAIPAERTDIVIPRDQWPAALERMRARRGS